MLEQEHVAEELASNQAQVASQSETVEESISVEPSMSDEYEQKLAALEQDLEKAREETKARYNDYLRAVAETENLRKRTLREKEDLAKYGQEGFFKDLLPVLDSLHQADAADASTEDMIEGMKLVRKQLWDVFEKHGLQQIEAEGQPFNPELHQAIAREECDSAKEELVHTEFAKGYQLHDRLLRASMVKVTVPKGE